MDETILQQVAFLRHATTNWLKHWKSAILGMRGEKKQKLVWKFHRDGIFCENKMDENIMIANNMMKRFASVPLFRSKWSPFGIELFRSKLTVYSTMDTDIYTTFFSSVCWLFAFRCGRLLNPWHTTDVANGLFPFWNLIAW